ncbi:MAG: 16S rRNA (guanine(966)-N(2))-methyltransferase RsmD [Ruminococcaceae bacterium]|nr:16S rRNA (guanine(966)-N(2))-methyltransferase RsmD [Oscillospiraceae bacterium]
MRVITGTAKGMKLKTLEGFNVRPTTAQVKEAIFSIIQFEIVGARVLDLFSGSGQLGIEALSRGAKRVVFVDNSRAAISIIGENLEHTKLEQNAVVKNQEVETFLKTTEEIFDIVFIDPPYSKGLLNEILPLLKDKMSDVGVIICETAKEEELLELENFRIHKVHKYGKIKLTVYRHL